MMLHLYIQNAHLTCSEKKLASTGPVGRKSCPAFCSSHNGFTLLELLISLVMIGIIAVIISSTIRLAVHVVNSGEKNIERLERTRTSFNIIDSQIQSQIPLTFDDNGEKKYYFQGDSGSLQFTTNYSIWGGQQGYVMVRYKVEPDDTGKQLLAVSENIIGTSSSRESMLFSTVDAINFEYFFKDPTEEKGKWVDKWTDTTNVPQKVKLHLINGEKNISMIIPMRTAGTLPQTSSVQAGPIPARTAGNLSQTSSGKAGPIPVKPFLNRK